MILLMATGPACIPGISTDINHAVADCNESLLQQFDLTPDERDVLLSKCNELQEQGYSDGEAHPNEVNCDADDEAGRNWSNDVEQEENHGTGEHHRVDIESLEPFNSEWDIDHGSNIARNTVVTDGSVLIAHDTDFRDVKIEVAVKPNQNSEFPSTQMGVIFRAYKINDDDGEGYFALVDTELSELKVGFHYADGDDEILGRMPVVIEPEMFHQLRVEANGHRIYVSYNNDEMELFDDRSERGVVGLIVTEGKAEFKDFWAEGTVIPQPNCGQDYTHDVDGEYRNDDSCLHYSEYNDDAFWMDSLQPHEGAWFNDGGVSGNVATNEASLQITNREFGDLFAKTRLLTQTQNTKMGIILRANIDEAGNSTGYFTALDAEKNQLEIGYHNGDGEDLILASAHIEIETGVFYNLDVEAVGSRIRVHCNDVALEIESDLSFYGVAGLVAKNGLAVFTEFEAKELVH
jgi:hypothetical protein